VPGRERTLDVTDLLANGGAAESLQLRLG